MYEFNLQYKILHKLGYDSRNHFTVQANVVTSQLL